MKKPSTPAFKFSRSSKEPATVAPPPISPKPALPLKKPKIPAASKSTHATLPIATQTPSQEQQPTEKPFERIQREDTLLYECIKRLGTKQADFIQNIDWLHAIFRDKAISYLDNAVIRSLKSKLHLILRPCDILFEDRDTLLGKAELNEKDIFSLTVVKQNLEMIAKELPEAIKEISDTTTLSKSSQRQLKKLPQLINELVKEYENAIRTLLKGSVEERQAVLTSRPHIKGPHLAHPVEITREMYCLINSVDINGVPYKENTVGAHRVTNTTVTPPEHVDPKNYERFLTKDKELRLFFKPNVDPIDETDFINPAAERRNGFAIRVHGAFAAYSTWFVIDEGVRFYDKEGEPDIHYSAMPQNSIPAHEKNFVKRNTVQVGMGNQGHAFEDIYFLVCFNEILIKGMGPNAFQCAFEKILDLPACIANLEKESWFTELEEFKTLPTIKDPVKQRDIAKKLLIALRETLKKAKGELSREAKIFLDPNKEEYGCGILGSWLNANKPKDFIHLIAQLNAAPELIHHDTLSAFLAYSKQLSIFRYFFPSSPASTLHEKLKNIVDLMSEEDYDNWSHASDYGFNDCTGSNVFAEVSARDNTTGDALAVIPVHIDNSEGPQHEAYRKDKAESCLNLHEAKTTTTYYIQYRNIAQTFESRMRRTVPKALVEKRLALDPYFSFAEFLKCCAKDQDDYEQSLEQGTITPSDYRYKFKSHKESRDLVENETLDIFSKFHDKLFSRIFRREKARHALLKQNDNLTYWDIFIKLFPIAGPAYKFLVEKHQFDVTTILEKIRRNSIHEIFEGQLDIQYEQRLNGRTVDPHDHIKGRVLSFEQMNAKIHKDEVSLSAWDNFTLLEFCNILAKYFPLPDMLSSLSKQKLQELIILAAKKSQRGALGLLLTAYEMIDEQGCPDIANLALLELLKSLPMTNEKSTIIKTLNTIDVLLQFVEVAENSPRLIKELLEGRRDPFQPILILSQQNKPFKPITKHIIGKLIRAGYDVEARDQKGLSAIDYAIMNNSTDMFCTLVDGSPRRVSSDLKEIKASQNLGAWKFLNEVKVVDFLLEHDDAEIPPAIRKKIMRNNRVAGEMIKRKIFINPVVTSAKAGVQESQFPIPVKTLEGEKHLSVDFIGLFIDKLGFLLQAETPAKEERKDEKHGTRPVVGVEYEGMHCHVKIDPEFPIFEEFGEISVQEAIGFGTSHSITLQFDKNTFESLLAYYKAKPSSAKTASTIKGLELLLKRKGKPIRVLVSNTVEGANCQVVMKQNEGNVFPKNQKLSEEQLANFMRFVLLMIPSIFKDAKPDNIILGPNLDLCLIDKGLNNLSAFNEQKLEFLCLPFNMHEMYQHLLIRVIYEILSIDVDRYLSINLKKFTNLCQAHIEYFGEHPEVPAELDSSWVFQHRARFNDMQTTLRKALDRLVNNEDPMNTMEILQRTLSKVWLAYRHGNNQDNTVSGRFFKTTQTVLSQLMNIYAGTKLSTAVALKTRFTKSVSSKSRAKKAHYDPKNALSDFMQCTSKASQIKDVVAELLKGNTTPFINLRVSGNDGFISLDELRESVISQIDFSTVAPTIQRTIIDSLKSEEGKVDFKKLCLLNMTELDKDDLDTILENCTAIRELSLRGCSGLNTDGSHFKLGGLKVKNRLKSSLLDIIKEKATSLISLDLSGSSVEEIKFAGTDLEQLEYLYLENCPNLTRAHVESNALKQLSLENNPLLTRVHFDSDLLSVLNLKGCTNLPADVLQKMLTKAAKLKRFTFEPGQNFEPRTLSWFVFQAWQPDVSRLSKEHRVTRHLLKAMIKDDVLQLGALPITETDLNDIREILASPDNKKDPIPCHTLDLRGLETFHRETIRQLTLDMMTGKNKLKEIKCQAKVRANPDVKPQQLEINPKPIVDVYYPIHDINRRINEILISPEGYAVLSSNSGLIQYIYPYNIENIDMSNIKTLKGHTDNAGSIVFTDTGDLLSAGPNEMILWNLRSQKQEVRKTVDQIHEVYFYTNGKIVSSSKQHFIEVWTLPDLKQEKSHRTPEYYAGEPHGILTVLPNQKIIYTHNQIPGIIREWTQGIVSPTTEYPSNVEDIAFFSIDHDGNLISLSNKDIVIWEYNSWKKLKSYPRNVNDGENIRRLPSREYLIHDNVSEGVCTLRVYDADFNVLFTLAEHEKYITAIRMNIDGSILYATNGSLIRLETQSTSIINKQISTILNSCNPIVIHNSIYFQTQNQELSRYLGDFLDTLFDVKISPINSVSQIGTLKVEFPNESALKDFYSYWHKLKNETPPATINNPHQELNITGINLTLEEVLCLAKNSPQVEHMIGLGHPLSPENYTTLLASCPLLKSLGGDPKQTSSLNIGFRVSLPRSINIERTKESLSITFTRTPDQFQIDAWESCIRFLKEIYPDLKRNKIQAPELTNYSSRHLEQNETIKFDSSEHADVCHTLLIALLSRHQGDRNLANSPTKNKTHYQLPRRNSFLIEGRRYSSSEEDNTLHTPPEIETSLIW